MQILFRHFNINSGPKRRKVWTYDKRQKLIMIIVIHTCIISYWKMINSSKKPILMLVNFLIIFHHIQSARATQERELLNVVVADEWKQQNFSLCWEHHVWTVNTNTEKSSLIWVGTKRPLWGDRRRRKRRRRKKRRMATIGVRGWDDTQQPNFMVRTFKHFSLSYIYIARKIVNYVYLYS